MNRAKNKLVIVLGGMLLFIPLSAFKVPVDKVSAEEAGISLTVEVSDLRNSTGSVQFTLYDREDAFPDEDFKKYKKKINGEIVDGSSTVTFKDLPDGRYAISILHDENRDGKIKKGVVLPKEGIGFSNYQSIGFSNRPAFSKASFSLRKDMKIKIKIIYM